MAGQDAIKGIEGIQPYFDGIGRDLKNIDFQPFGRLELFELADAHAKYFADATAPDGSPWPRLEPSTIARKGHDTILVDTTRLIKSLTAKGGGGDAIRDLAVVGDATHIIFGTAVEYSLTLEQPNMHGKTWLHVGVNDQFLDGFIDRVLRYTVNELAAIT